MSVCFGALFVVLSPDTVYVVVKTNFKEAYGTALKGQNVRYIRNIYRVAETILVWTSQTRIVASKLRKVVFICTNSLRRIAIFT